MKMIYALTDRGYLLQVQKKEWMEEYPMISGSRDIPRWYTEPWPVFVEAMEPPFWYTTISV